MKYDDKRPPAPRLMRPEDVNKAVRRTPPKKSRRSRPTTPPPTVEEHKNNLNKVVKQSADKTRKKIEEDKARKLQEERERKEAEEKARVQKAKEEKRSTPRKVVPRTSTSSTTVSHVANNTSASSYKKKENDTRRSQESSSHKSVVSEEKAPLYKQETSHAQNDPALEEDKDNQDYNEVVADPSVVYRATESTGNSSSANNARQNSSKTKTSTMSPGELARTIENSKKTIKQKRTGINISAVTMSIFSIFLASSLSVLGAYSYGIYKDSTVEKVENAAYERGIQDATGDVTVDSVMRVTPEKLTEMIMSSPNANFPPNPILTDFNLTGYSVPGGDEGRGRANLDFCYAANDVEGKRSGRAYFISDDANTEEPFWRVDAVNLTQDPCN